MEPKNFRKPVLCVRHEFLRRCSDSPFKVHCVVCGGVLLVARAMPSTLLRRCDCCSRCGQRYFYLDQTIGGEPLEGD
jgi:hypothetical protein